MPCEMSADSRDFRDIGPSTAGSYLYNVWPKQHPYEASLNEVQHMTSCGSAAVRITSAKKWISEELAVI